MLRIRNIEKQSVRVDRFFQISLLLLLSVTCISFSSALVPKYTKQLIKTPLFFNYSPLNLDFNCESKFLNTTTPPLLSEDKTDCPGRFVDSRDNQMYSAVRIGKQCWMSENLNIGTSVEFNTQAADNGQIEKYCFENNPDNCELHGGLYTWDEMMGYSVDQQGICPTGWHVPDNNEWAELELTIGIEADSIDYLNWRGREVGQKLLAGNSSGFEATFGGYRSDEGLFLTISELAIFWTSSLKAPGLAWYRKVSAQRPGVSRNYFSTIHACSLRCIKD
ncbi:MAG: hypothetical protein K9H64_01120 [Bacteroidales bacterium]|nr:hypothetical protein [Bacteroidales bacterium]MCF8454746.1 hypothetical protein [Bacteroidales bacterium]